MVTWRVNNATLLGGEVCAEWQNNHAYSLGARCVCRYSYGPQNARKRVFECTTPGNSGTGEPTWDWSDVGDTTVDNEVTWTCRSPDDGTWNNATCFMWWPLFYSVAAGDIVYVHKTHHEYNHSESWNIYGVNSLTQPLRIYCVDKADDSLAVGAVIDHLVAEGRDSYFQYSGYAYGVTFRNSENSINIMGSYPGMWILEGNGSTILLELGNTANPSVIRIGQNGGGPNTLRLLNGNVKFAYRGSAFHTMYRNELFEWIGGALQTPALGCNTLFYPNYGLCTAHLRDVDLSALGAGNSIVDGADETVNFNILLERCKFPADVHVVRGNWPKHGCGRVRCHHCSDGNRYYDFEEATDFGTIRDETTIVRSEGFTDGTTPQSWKMESGLLPDCNNDFALESPPIAGWTEATTEKTFSVEFAADGATHLQNDEVWMELEYPANNTDGLGDFVRDKCAQLGTPADKSASTEVWETDGMEPIGATSTWTKTYTGGGGPDAKVNYRNVIPNADISADGSRVRLKLHGYTYGLNITGCSIGLRDGSTGNFASPPTRVTFNGGENNLWLPPYQFVYSDWIDFPIDEENDYLVHFALVTDTANYFRLTSGAGCYAYWKYTTDDDTLTETLSGYGTYSQEYIITEILVAPASEPHTYKCSVSATPGKKGPITARIYLAKPLSVIYVDPIITET